MPRSPELDAAQRILRSRFLGGLVAAPRDDAIEALVGKAHAWDQFELAVHHISGIVVVHLHHRAIAASAQAFHPHEREEPVGSGAAVAYDAQHLFGVLQDGLGAQIVARDILADLQEEAPGGDLLVHGVEVRHAPGMHRRAAALLGGPLDGGLRQPVQLALGQPQHFKKCTLRIRIAAQQFGQQFGDALGGIEPCGHFLVGGLRDRNRICHRSLHRSSSPAMMLMLERLMMASEIMPPSITSWKAAYCVRQGGRTLIL